LGQYQQWQLENGYHWHQPNLKQYRDHLLKRLSPRSAKQHLSTIRSRYQSLLKDNAVRRALYEAVGEQLEKDGVGDTPANRKAYVDELVTQLENDIDPENSRVTVTKAQDTFDSDHIRLSVAQANTLLSMPALDTLEGIRDTAIIGLMLCTGIREAELASLDVKDLRQTINGELALRIREGKGKKARGIPYGELDWILAIVDLWLEKAGIENGPVFRGFKSRWMNHPRKDRITTRAVQKILKKYPVSINGELRDVKPHDLRRTYAKLFYEAGGDLVALQQNLGHASINTTIKYIGDRDIDKRRAPAMLAFDLSQLNGKH
jgi:site-specific recombinase XerD